MPTTLKKGIQSGMDIFRPIAAAARGCASTGAGDEDVPGQLQCTTIFRGKGKGDSRNVRSTFSSEDSVVMSFPVQAWPPADIPGSESTDSKSVDVKRKHKLNRSVPVRGESDEKGSPYGRGLTPRKQNGGKTPPSYYKIEMQGDKVQLSAGDDNSVRIDSDHNKRITQSGEKSRNISRASPIVEISSEKVLAASDMEDDHKWTVSPKGEIIAIPKNGSKEEAALRGNSTTKKDCDNMKYTSTELSSPQNYSSMPILTKASTDSQSAGSNDELLPESPPRLDRSALSTSLFEEDSNTTNSKRTGSHKSSQKSKSSSSDSNGTNGQSGSRMDFMSQLIDFFSLTCCEATVCKNGCYSQTVMVK